MPSSNALTPVVRTLALIVLILAAVPARADHLFKGIRISADVEAPMTFRLGTDTLDSNAIWMVGEIKPDSGTAFRSFLDKNKAAIRPGMTVIMHSPGGQPDAGMAIGRAIRALGLQTAIGQSSMRPGYLPGTVEPGVCASSCAFAFLGGVERHVRPGSLYGVHDINLNGTSLNDNDLSLAVGQALAAQYTDYINEMGVDTKLAVDASNYDSRKGETHYLTAAEMAALRVTSGLTTTWQIEQVGTSFPLVGSSGSDVPPQANQLSFWCAPQPSPHLLLGVSFVPPSRTFLGVVQTPASFSASIRSFQLAANSVDTAASIPALPILDIAPSEIDQAIRPTGAAHVSAFFKLTPTILAYVNSSQVLMVRFRNGRELSPEDASASFDADIAAGRAKIAAFVTSCR